MTLSDSLLLNYAAVFGSGIVVSFSPCLYPVMPVTAGIIAGANIHGGRLSAFLTSLIYVLGLAVTYSVLGVAASLTGQVFGQFQNHPVVYFMVGNILIVLSLILLDVIPMGDFGFQVQNKIRAKGMVTIFVLGMASGLIVGPCTAPILGALLLFVGSKQNILYGASLFFIFSFGMGASLILIGTFSGLLAKMPSSGPWMLRIKRLSAVVLILVGEYFLVKSGTLIDFL
jgi:cytochrome c-type biogenesis protein